MIELGAGLGWGERGGSLVGRGGGQLIVMEVAGGVIRRALKLMLLLLRRFILGELGCVNVTSPKSRKRKREKRNWLMQCRLQHAENNALVKCLKTIEDLTYTQQSQTLTSQNTHHLQHYGDRTDRTKR